MPRFDYGVANHKIILDRQTQSIADDLLPLSQDAFSRIRTTKKLDLALAIVSKPQSKDAVILTTTFRERGPWSQMTDAYTQSKPLVCGIEVKTASGDSLEAKAQFAIWSAAGLMHIQRLIQQPASSVQPYFGFVVVGH